MPTVLLAGLLYPCPFGQAPDPASEPLAHRLCDRDRAVHYLDAPLSSRPAPPVASDLARLKVWAHHWLFEANPETHDSRKWDPSYRTWDPQTQTLAVSPVEKDRALEAFWRMEEHHRPPAGRAARRAAVEALVNTLLAHPVTQLWTVHWDNQDDTAFDGLIALDLPSGRVRVLMTHDFA